MIGWNNDNISFMESTDPLSQTPGPASIRPTCVLVHYDEIALKGENRRFFEETLARAIRTALEDLGVASVKRLYGRLFFELPEICPWEEVRGRLQTIYGISHFEAACQVKLDLEDIQKTIWEAVKDFQVESFCLITRRPNKNFPLDSMEVNRKAGQYIAERSGWKVSLDEPRLPIYLYLLDRHAYFAIGKIKGPGGLPVGVAGKVVCLISGGIDSPVAASRMMRRGCFPIFVHFHSAPYTDRKSQEKVKELAAHLMRHIRPTRLYLIPFAELQQRIVAEAPAALRVILYRRFMMRAAAAIARKERAKALVTGENLGQVASQTIANMATIEKASPLPILRPLLGFDKLEIVREAERLGTFAISIQPHDDCCSFLMPRHPATASTPSQLEEAERAFAVEEEVEMLVQGAEVVEIGKKN